LVSFFIFEFVIGSFNFKKVSLVFDGGKINLDDKILKVTSIKVLPPTIQHNTFLEIV